MTRDAAREADPEQAAKLRKELRDPSVAFTMKKRMDAGWVVEELLAENAALRRALEPLARVALPEDFHPGAPGEPAEDGWCNIYTGGLTNGDIRRARKLIPTPPAGGAHG